MNEQLERLINMALIDGVLTEKEREILKRKAEASGFDPDEFEMELEAKLYEKQHLQQSQVPQDSGLIGIYLLLKKISDIQEESEPEIKVEKEEYKKLEDADSFFSNVGTYFNNGSKESDAYDKIEEWKLKQKERILEIIKASPMPNSIEEIIEFLTYSVPLSTKGGKTPQAPAILRVIPQFKMMEAADNYMNAKDEAEIINNNDLGYDGRNYTVLLRYNWKLKSEQLVKKGRTLIGDNKDLKNQIELFAKELGMPMESSGSFFGLFK